MNAPTPVPFAEAVRLWARVALLSFGGPAGQIAIMHRLVVEEKGWVDERRFLQALNFCMLLPGPEAQQLATYLGWLMHGVRGGLVAGLLFILPGFVAMLALSWLYFLWGDVDAIEALFFGLKAAVLAIVLDAVRRIGARTLTRPLLVAIASAAFAAIFLFAVPFPLIVAAAGLAGALWLRGAPLPAADAVPPDAAAARKARRAGALFLLLWLAPVAVLLATLGVDHVFSRIALFFSQTAVVTFGGAYAVLAYVAQQAVEQYGWLRPGEMLDGLGLAETTPGPLIMVTQFVGFLGAARAPGALDPLLAGTLGALLTTWVTFAPCFAWIFLGAPIAERLRHNGALSAALAAITAAVVGVILNLALWFALHTLFREVRDWRGIELPVLASADWGGLLLAAAAIVSIVRFRVGPIGVLAGCAAAGLLFNLFRIG